MSDILLNFGLAILTILVPLAIAILTDLYQKRKEQAADFAELDLHVILDEVFKIKKLIFYVALIFTPLFIWETSPSLLRLMEFVVSMAGIILTSVIILHVYNWTKGNVWKYRFSYLERIKKPDDLEVIWRSVWQTPNVNIPNERQFFHKFSSVVDELFKRNE